MKKFTGFERGMGIGGWLTNYKRFHVLSPEKRAVLTVGDIEHFKTYITERDAANIAAMGFDHIRLGFDQVVLEDERGEYREELWALLDRFVHACFDCGLNAVLNLHKAVGNYCDVADDKTPFDDATLRARFIALWSELARRYKGERRVALELLNEVKDINPELWNSLAEETIAAIRGIDKTAKIIVGSTCWNSVDRLKDLRVWDDENVIYTFHFYEPFEFTHQRGVLQAEPCFYNREMPYPCDIERYRHYRRTVKGERAPFAEFDAMDGRVINKMLAPAADFIAAHPDKILWCGEFGTIRHARMEWRKAWFRDVIRFLKAHAIPYSVWNYLSTPNDGNRFSLTDDDTRRILDDELLDIVLGK